MTYSYELNLEDLMTYQKILFLSGKNPSITNAIRRWQVFCFFLMLVAAPMFVYGFSGNIYFVALFLLIAGGVYWVKVWHKGSQTYWKGYKKTVEKDVKQMYFQQAETISYTVNVLPQQLECESAFAKKIFKKEDILFTEITAQYLFIYSQQHDATYIPLEKITKEKQTLLDWFA